MLTSKELVEKIMKFEGCRLEAYQDVAGVWTIGYGHAHGVSQGDVITDYLAKEFLKKDISMAEKQVLALGVCKTQGQLDALTDFVFNLGIERLKQSTLLKVIKADFPSEEIIRQFRRWVYANGERQPGLVARRRWESIRYFEPSKRLDDVQKWVEKGEDAASVEEVEDDEYLEHFDYE